MTQNELIQELKAAAQDWTEIDSRVATILQATIGGILGYDIGSDTLNDLSREAVRLSKIAVSKIEARK